MLAYIARRLLLIVPTLFGIMVVNFAIVQVAPGGPIELMIARAKGSAVEATARVSGAAGETARGGAIERAGAGPAASDVTSKYRGARGLDPEFIKQLEKQYGFDQPAWRRFATMMKRYIAFDFGTSFFRDRPVLGLMLDKLPVSISLGLWTTLLIYLISIPLGVAKAVRDGSGFDVWTSAVVIVGYAIPGFLFAILIIVLFAGGSFLNVFPLRGLVSAGFAQMSVGAKIADYFWHITLPIVALVIGGFAGLTMLTKNSFLEEIGKQYVVTARAKGLSQRAVVYVHAFRNALVPVVTVIGITMAVLIGGAVVTEIVFNIPGLGRLIVSAILRRDYPVVQGVVLVTAAAYVLINLAIDVLNAFIDPRIRYD